MRLTTCVSFIIIVVIGICFPLAEQKEKSGLGTRSTCSVPDPALTVTWADASSKYKHLNWSTTQSYLWVLADVMLDLRYNRLLIGLSLLSIGISVGFVGISLGPSIGSTLYQDDGKMLSEETMADTASDHKEPQRHTSLGAHSGLGYIHQIKGKKEPY